MYAGRRRRGVVRLRAPQANTARCSDAELLAAVYVELTTKHLTDALLCISQFEITVLTRVIW